MGSGFLAPLLFFILFLAARVCGPTHFGANCPWVSMVREAVTLSLVTCHTGFSRHGIDPVGETTNVPDTPLGSRRLVLSPRPATAAGGIHVSTIRRAERVKKVQEASRAQQAA